MPHVRLLVSDALAAPDGLVAMLGGTEVRRAHANDPYGGYTVVTIDMPAAPANAHTVVPHFARTNGRTILASVEYLDTDGRCITACPAAA